MLLKKTLLAAAALAMFGLSVAASAATSPATASFNVTLKVNAACTVSTSGDLVFAPVDANTTTDLTANASNINVVCSKKTPYTIGVKPSNGSLVGTGVMAGQTAGNTDTVAYALFSDAADTTVWGDTAGTNRVTGTIDTVGNVSKAYTVYGKVLGTALNVTPDNYQDSVTVSVYY